MDGFQVELLNRLPLAQATLEIFNWVFDATALNNLFERHRGRCYEKELSFATLTHLIRDALVLHGGSGRASFEAAEALPVAYQNVYAKLGRLPLELSMALLSDGSARIGQLMPQGAGSKLPKSLKGFAAIVFDGKKIKNAAKRLKALRHLPGKMLGGKLLVALSLESGLAIAMNADPDGERNDVPLVAALVPQVRERIAKAVLWIADRQFADLNIPALLCSREGDHFLLRCTKTPGFTGDLQRPAQEGKDPEGRRFVQEWGWLGSEKNKRRRYIRRITLFRGQGEEDVILITDLLDEKLYPAVDLLEAYLRRWGIEKMFQQVTEVFDLQKLIGSTPQAMIFQSTLCFLLYNIVQALRVYAAADGERQPEEVSTEKLFNDAKDELKSWAKLGDAALVAKLLPKENDAAVVIAWLGSRLTGIWRDRWIKAPNKKPSKAKKPAKVPKGHGGHTSVWRVLEAARHKRQKGGRS